MYLWRRNRKEREKKERKKERKEGRHLTKEQKHE